MNQNKKTEKTSLEKSHSAWSNTKLTAVCVLASLSVSTLWAFVALDALLSPTVLWIGRGVSAALTALSVLLFRNFKR